MSNKRCSCWSSRLRSINAHVQLARRRMAKRWHPDIAPPGPPARAPAPPPGDQRGGRPARSSSPRPRAAGGSAATPSRSRPPPRARRARRPAAAPTRRSSARAPPPPTARSTIRSARASPTTRSSTATRAACPTPSGASARSAGSTSPATATTCSSGRASRSAVGVRTIPAGSLQFVDFSKPDPAADRVERFMTAAQHALAEGNPGARRPAARLRARRRADEPGRAAAADRRVLAGGQPARRRRAPCATGRASRPTARRPSASRRGSTRTWARSTSRPRPPSARPNRAPARCVRLGAARAPAPAADGPDRRDHRARARAADGADRRGPARPRARLPPRRRRRRRGLGGARPRPGSTRVSQAAWSALRARAGPDRPGAGVHRRLPDARSSSGPDPEVADLLQRVEAAGPRELSGGP